MADSTSARGRITEQILSIDDNRVQPAAEDTIGVLPSSGSSASSDSKSSPNRRSRTMPHQIVHVESIEALKGSPVSVQKTWATAKEAFKSGKTLSYSFRLEQLKQCKRMMIEWREEILQAIKDDLRKPRFEAVIADYHGAYKELDYQIDNLRSNMKDVKGPLSIWSGVFDRAYVKLDPYGVVLIIGPWNYPFCLNLQPLWGAIAAGNCAIIKPSEVSMNSSIVLGQMIPKYLDNTCYHVIQGDVEATLDLLKLRFDYILATGSTLVGKSIMRAAAEFLTPVTLELGGKSPVYIDESTNIEAAIKRVLWGKCINVGQTCISPDYILCNSEIEKRIVKLVPVMFQKWFGDDLQQSSDLGRIINEKHFNRLKKLLDETKGKIAYGGSYDIKDLWISPTILVNVDGSDITMQDEIFGPILPIIRVKDSEDAIEFINARPKPLTLYLFCSKRGVLKDFKMRTSSGQVCINDTIVHPGWKHVPFGGVGDSGMGSYHDKYTFRTFSHEKAIVHRSIYKLNEFIEQRRYPPHDDKNIKYFLHLMRWIDSKYSFIEFNGAAAVVIGVLIGLFMKSALSLLFPCLF